MGLHMSNAISYMRFSSGQQKHGDSIRRQQKLLQSWLVANPTIPLSNLSVADLGKSGYHGQHLDSGLGQILTAIADNKIRSGDYLLVEAVDRIGRLDVMSMFNIFSQIISAGVTIITLDDNVSYSRESLTGNGAAIYILIAKIQQAHLYSDNLSKRISAVHEKKRIQARDGESVKVNRVPYWLTTNGQIIAKRGEFIKEIIDLYLNGHGFRTICGKMQAKYDKNTTLKPSNIKQWVANRALIGEWESKDGLIKNCFEPLIDNNTWLKIVAATKDRSFKRGPVSLDENSGLFVCGYCQSTMTIKKGRYSFYQCSTNCCIGKHACSHVTCYNKDVVDFIFKQDYIYTLLGHSVKSVLSDQLEKIKAIQVEIEKIDSQIENIVDLIATVSSQKAKDKLIKLEAEKTEYLNQISDIENSVNVNDVDEAEATELFNDADVDPIKRRTILKKMGYRLVLKNNYIYTENKLPFSYFKMIRFYRVEKCYIVEAVKENDNFKFRSLLAIKDGNLLAKMDIDNDVEITTDCIRKLFSENEKAPN